MSSPFNAARLISLLVLWVGCFLVGFLLHDLGTPFLRALIQVAIAGSIAVWMVTVQPPLSRSPIIRGAAAFLWVVYAIGAAILAFSLFAALGSMPARIIAVLHLLWIGLALLIHYMLERILKSVDREVHARLVERAGVEDLREAVLRLKLDASAWPINDRRRDVDASLRDIENAVKYAPARVPRSAEMTVDEAIACVQEASDKLSRAESQAEDWYVSQLQGTARRVKALMTHVESMMSVGGART